MPSILDLAKLDSIISVDDGDAIIMVQKLAGVLGIGVGISSGANFLGALKVQSQLDKDATVVTILPDDNKKYLTTDLLREEPVKDDFLGPQVTLLGFRAFKRVCHTCCDPADCMQTGTGDSYDEIPLPRCPRREPRENQ